VIGGTAAVAQPLVAAHGLAVRYGRGETVLHDVDLAVESGQIVALLGPNGSGKSSLLRALSGDLVPSRGSVHRAAPYGYAADDAVHVDALTVRTNAEWFARACGGAPAVTALPPLLAAFGLDPWQARPAGELSFGGRRKLALVQALAHEPPLVLLDEPTVGLDPDAVLALLDRLRATATAGGAVVFAANDLARAGEVATRVVFLRAGRIVADAPPDALLRQVRGTVRFEIDLAGEAPPVLFDDDVEAAAVAGGFVLDAASTAALPGVCRALEDAGARILAIRVHEVDLTDAWRAITGDAWQVEPVDR
jgi:ABC-type multidrug transport system ATPase subunit